MSKRMAKLYEKAWNKVVENLVPWKKDIIVSYYITCYLQRLVDQERMTT